MYRKLVKAAVLVSFVALTFYLCRSNTLIACIAATCMLMHGVASYDRDFVLKGDDEDPGLLVISSIGLPLGSVTLLVGVPHLFNQAGYYDSWTFDWLYAVTAFFAGLMLAVYLWIPFLLYWLVDLIFNRFGGHRADVSVV